MKINPLFLNLFKESPTLAINEQVKKRWLQGENIFHLGFGESRFSVHPTLQAALERNAHRKEYLPMQGLPQLRTAVADFYQANFDIPCHASQVTIAPGSKLLLYSIQMILDGALLLPTPSWVSYHPQATMLNKKTYWIESSSKNHEPSVQSIKNAWNLAKKEGHAQGLLLLNSPNNPTGRMISPKKLEKIADFCRKEKIIVLSDEIYGMVTFEENIQCSIAKFYTEGTIIFSGVSKNLSLGGWRMGYAILPKEMEVVSNILGTIASETWSAVSSPIQWALSEVFNDKNVLDYAKESALIHGLRSSFLWKNLVEMGVSCAEPQGAFYLFPNFDFIKKGLSQKGVETSEQLAHYLLEHYSIATLPGSAFGCSPSTLNLRLSSSFLDMETDEKAQWVLNLYRKNGATNFVESLPNLQGVVQRFLDFIKNHL